MKRLTLFALMMLLALAPAAAQARPGALDPSFGRDGRVIRSADFGGLHWSVARTRIAALPDGRFVVLVSDSLYGFWGNGAIGGAFGAGEGRLPIPPGSEFTPAGIAADATGRVVVAGTLSPSGGSLWRDESALVVRYTPAGELDLSFGIGGVVITNFGLPPLKVPEGSQAPTQVQVAGVAVDSQGRAVLTGTRTRMIGPCRGTTNLAYHDAFAARLDGSGGADPSFGDGGVARMYEIAKVGEPVLDSEDGVYVTTPYAGRGPCTEPRYDRLVGHLDVDGRPDPRFGDGGWVSLPFRKGAVTVDGALGANDKLLLFGGYRVERSARRHRPAHEIVTVERLLPNGSRDRSFGGDGLATLSAPRGSLEVGQGAVDASGRVLVAGTYLSDRNHKRRTFFLGRLTPRGSRDLSFGRAGLTVTGWGKGAAAVGSSLLVGPSWALVAGTARSSHFGAGSGLALARYLTR